MVPSALFAQAPVLNMKSAASAGRRVGRAAGRRSPSPRRAWPPRCVVGRVIVGCVPYAATKLISDSGCFRCWPKSDQSVYGASWPSLVSARMLPAQLVQRRDAGLTGAGHVDRRQVERKAEQVVAQGLRHELVELVADLVRRAHDDRAGGLLRRVLRRVGASSGCCEVRRRVEERVEQRQRVVVFDAVGVARRARDVVVEHRVPEAVDGVGELGRDRRVDVGVVDVERPDGRLDLARELLEHEVLVLHLGDEAGGLEQALAVVPAGSAPSASGSPARARAATPSGDVSVVRVCLMSSTRRSCSEWKIWWIVGQRDVLVDAAVTGDEVRVEQLVVVRAGRLLGEVGRGRAVRVRRRRRPAASPGCGPCPAGSGPRCARCRVRNGVSKCADVRRDAATGRRRGCPRRAVAVLESTNCGSPCGPGDELAVRVGGEHRDVRDVRVDRGGGRAWSRGLRLDRRPGRHAASAVGVPGRRPARGRRAACRSSTGPLPVGRSSVVLAQEDLVRRMRRVGLALVDPGRVGVLRVLDVVGALVAGWPGCPRMPSGPGWFWARVSTMNAWLRRTSSPCRACRPGRA